MNHDPPRLIDSAGDDLGRSLLDFGVRERPSHAARQRVHAAALGSLGVAVTTPLAAAPAAVAAKSGLGSVLVWLGAGALAGAVTSGAAVYASEPRSPAPRLDRVAAPPIAPPPEAIAQPVAPSPDVPAIAAAEPEGSPAKAAPQRSSGAPEAPRPPGDSLATELAELERGRRALASGDPTAALAALDDHARGPGVLGQEATVLRVEALLAKGDRVEAARLGRRFLADHGASPSAARVRALVTRAERGE